MLKRGLELEDKPSEEEAKPPEEDGGDSEDEKEPRIEMDDPEYIPLPERPRYSVIVSALPGKLRYNSSLYGGLKQYERPDLNKVIVIDTIARAADRYSRIVYRMALFVLYHHLDCCKNNLPFPTMDREYLFTCVNLFKHKSQARERIPTKRMIDLAQLMVGGVIYTTGIIQIIENMLSFFVLICTPCLTVSKLSRLISAFT